MDDAEKAWAEYAVGGEHGGTEPVTYRGAFMAGRESLRSRIAALEAVIESVRAWEKSRRVDHGQHFHSYPIDDSIISWKTREARDVAALIDAAPSTVLDQMIREAKAEGWDERHALTHAWSEDNPYRNRDA